MSKELQLERPRRVTVVESIIEQLVALIRNGTLKAGDKLPSERELIEMLGVSRSSVREALQALAAMDLVEGRVGEGTFVKGLRKQVDLGPDISTLSAALQKEMRVHLNQARLILERGIVESACKGIDAAGAASLQRVLDAYLNADENLSSDARWIAHDQIHIAIAEVTGNPLLVRLLQTLLGMVPWSLRDRGFLDGTSERNARHQAAEREIHIRLCEAVIRGDAPAALAWIERHAAQEADVIAECYG